MPNSIKQEYPTNSKTSNYYENIPFFKKLPPRQKVMVHRLYRTKKRIKKWADTNGWENLKNYTESIDENGNTQDYQTDHDYVNGFFKYMLNCSLVDLQKSDSTNVNYSIYRGFSLEEIETLSKIWARYPDTVQYVQDMREHRNMHYPNGWRRVATVNANEIVRRYMESDSTQDYLSGWNHPNNGWSNHFGNMVDDLERLNNA